MHVTSSSSASRYYAGLPPAEHAPGDIWMRLPSVGSTDARAVTGIVITPACDLANDKTDTLTYLPVVTVNDYFSGPAAYSLLRPVVLDQLKAAGRADLSSLLPRGRIPVMADLDLVRSEIPGATGKPGHATRASAGIEAMRSMHRGENNRALISECLGESKLGEVYARVVRNAYAEDIHFLPPDEQPGEWSAIPEPSVVLFRYPTAQPIGWFDRANAMEELQAAPLKTARLHHEFLTDLLTRFTRLYVRLGSADFSEDAIKKMVGLIKDAPKCG